LDETPESSVVLLFDFICNGSSSLHEGPFAKGQPGFI
jgi:hypothetical protein